MDSLIVKISIKSYLSIWLYTLFITSFVITTAVKGATVGYVLSFLALPVGLLSVPKYSGFFLSRLILLVLIYVGLILLSQLYIIIFPILPNSSDIITISKDAQPYLRSSLFTQSLYLISCFITFTFVRTYYDKNRHDKHLIKALIIFVFIGFYFWFYYFLFGNNGDKLSNRISGDDVASIGFQAIYIAGLNVTRFVSLTGEPSMYVFSILPFCIYFFHDNQIKIASLLFASLLLTFSGTFILGIGIYFVTLVVYSKNRIIILIVGVVFIVSISTLFAESIVNIIIKEALLDKLNQNNYSGVDRTQNLTNHLSYFLNLPVWLIFTGVGFGYVRSAEFFSTLLVNTGLIGFTLFTIFLLQPVFVLQNTPRNKGLKMALIVVYCIMMAGVSEYSFLSLWLLVGIAYNQIDSEKYKIVA
ncbi:hypothetical protein [Spirosoma gilvum]